MGEAPHSPISSVGQSAVLILCIPRNVGVSSATLMSPVRARYGTGQSLVIGLFPQSIING